MAKDFESLKAMVNETKGTVISAARVIRGLIQERNIALGAAKPADVVAHAKTQQVAIEAADLQEGLDVARKDLDAAISEAGATPTPIAPKVATVSGYPKHLSNAGGIEKVVNNPAEENAARAAGFVTVIPSPGYPKTLGDSTGAGRPNVVVNSAAEQSDAQAKGFTTVV